MLRQQEDIVTHRGKQTVRKQEENCLDTESEVKIEERGKKEDTM